MPYQSTRDLPPHVRKLSKKKQRQWLHVFNSMYGKGGEGHAFAAANSVVKKSFGILLKVRR